MVWCHGDTQARPRQTSGGRCYEALEELGSSLCGWRLGAINYWAPQPQRPSSRPKKEKRRDKYPKLKWRAWALACGMAAGPYLTYIPM
ncbi:hypothetical protein THAOC_26775, partial [Thalassiosira oceanica]